MGGRFRSRILLCAACGTLAVGFASCAGGTTTTTATGHTIAAKAPNAAEAEAEAKRRRQDAAEKKRRDARERERAAAERHREAVDRRREEAARKLAEEAGHGLGATKAVFEANNTMVSQEGSEPPEGTDYYEITETAHGRVTGYAVTIYASPPFSDQERIGLLGGVNLPDGTEPLPGPEGRRCYAWRSPILKRLIGSEYAEGTTESGTDTARMQAVSSTSC
jgi:hypothetical protein